MTKEPWRMVKNHSWNRYKKIITDFLDWDAGRQTITWAKHVNQYLNHAEDDSPRYYNIPIEALCYFYTYFKELHRTNRISQSGRLLEL